MEFSFVQITDHHLTASDGELLNGFSTRHSFRAVLRHIAQNAGNRADFIFSTGDLVDRPSETNYQAVLELLAAKNQSAEIPGPVLISTEGFQDFPMFLLPGNHDDRNYFFKCLFPSSPAVALSNVAFVHKGIQFICLDWGAQSKARAHPETLDFLARSLHIELPSVLIMHHQVTEIGSRWLDSFIANDIARFWDLVTGKNVMGIFSGHVHTSYEKTIKDIPVFGLRSTSYSFVLQDEPLPCLVPPHYRLVTVRDGKLTTEIFEVPL